MEEMEIKTGELVNENLDTTSSGFGLGFVAGCVVTGGGLLLAKAAKWAYKKIKNRQKSEDSENDIIDVPTEKWDPEEE